MLSCLGCTHLLMQTCCLDVCPSSVHMSQHFAGLWTTLGAEQSEPTRAFSCSHSHAPWSYCILIDKNNIAWMCLFIEKYLFLYAGRGREKLVLMDMPNAKRLSCRGKVDFTLWPPQATAKLKTIMLLRSYLSNCRARPRTPRISKVIKKTTGSKKAVKGNCFQSSPEAAKCVILCHIFWDVGHHTFERFSSLSGSFWSHILVFLATDCDSRLQSNTR